MPIKNGYIKIIAINFRTAPENVTLPLAVFPLLLYNCCNIMPVKNGYTQIIAIKFRTVPDKKRSEDNGVHLIGTCL